eukprot:15464434-Alexandrium_andersonii.AAC.1
MCRSDRGAAAVSAGAHLMPRAPVFPPGTHAVPEAAMGYCFLAKDGSDTSLTVLVLKDRSSRAILARPVLCKGRLREDTVGHAVSGIHRLEHHRK